MGALGLTIASGGEVPRLLRDVLEHHAHYRACAIAHAPACAQAHSGAAVVAGLDASGATGIAAAKAST